MQGEVAAGVESGGAGADGGGAAVPDRRGNAIAGVVVAAAAMAVLWPTLDDYGFAWDEGFTIEREERLGEWFARVTGDPHAVRWAWDPSLSKLDHRFEYLRDAGAAADSPWSRPSLRYYWPFAREEPNGHPPLYALLGLAGRALTYRLLPPLESYRFGPAALFAATVGVMYSFMARYYGPAAGLMAAFGLLTMPRVFAHAHLASYDAPTLSFWFLAVAAFLRASGPPACAPGGRLASWGWPVAFGLAWGCAAATKLTGWFIPVPLAAWAAFYRDRRAARALVVGALVAAAVVYAAIPPWWAEPIAGLRVFLESNLTRHKLLPIPTEFLGRLYRFSLPWYNTLVITATVVPPATLLLALAGIGRLVAGRFRDRVGTLLLVCWAFFMVLRALPNAPGHDYERQFLAGFAYLACLSGIGLAAIATWLERPGRPRWVGRAASTALLAAAVGGGAWSTWRYHPLQLSYYNALIGGLSGATRAGMEPTYYWEALTPDVRAWLNRNTAKGRLVGFDIPAMSFEYLHHWGLIPPIPIRSDGPPPQWYVVMNRPGHLKLPPPTIGFLLLKYGKPVFVKSLDVAPDVPLVAIYRGEDAYAAEVITGQPTGWWANPEARRRARTTAPRHRLREAPPPRAERP